MGEEGIFLKDRIHFPLIGRKIIDLDSIKINLATTGFLKPTDNPECSGFSASAGTKECNKFIFAYIEVDIVQCFCTIVVF